MKKKIECYDGELVVEYDETDELKDKVFQTLIEYFTKHKAFSGESIMQNDGPIIAASDVLSDIADDVIKFKETWVDG